MGELRSGLALMRAIDGSLRDLRTAHRTLRRAPWFTLTSVLAVALGIGANVAVFSLINSILLHPLPYPHQDELVAVSARNTDRIDETRCTPAEFDDWVRASHSFQGLAGYWDNQYTITGTERTESVLGWQVTANLFTLLGTQAALGRVFLPGEDEPARNHVVLLSHGFWMRRFDADPGVVGRALQLDGQPYTIVGVMPSTFAHPDPHADLWTPLDLQTVIGDRKTHALHAIARLRTGVTLGEAESEMEDLSAHLGRQYPGTDAGWTVAVRPIRDLYVGDLRGPLVVLQVAVGFLLLIACVNVVMLVLAKATTREREIAIRLALGGGPGRLVRQFLAEGLIIAFVGAAAGLFAGDWAIRMLTTLFASELRAVDLPATWLDREVLAWTALISLGVGLVFGVTPLLRRPRDPYEALRSSGRAISGGGGTTRIRNGLVAAQIALSLPLMVGAVLLARTYMGLASRPLGFKTDRALGAVLLLPSNRYANAEHTTPLFERLLIDVRALPGVESAALTSAIPLSGMNARRPYSLTGSPDTISTQDDRADFHVVTPAYFDVMGIPLRRGRVFDDRDRAEAPEVVVVNDVLARRLWPNADPVGQTIMVPDQFSPARRQVVGVVGSTRHSGPASEPTPEIYRPAYQTYWPFWGLIVRTATDPSSAHLPLTRAIWAVDKDISILSVRNLTELAAESYGPRRASFVLLAALAMLAVILTVFGIYGVIAYTVAQRAKEIGIRIALGATPARVVMSLVRQSAPWTLLGVTAGLLLALALTRFLRTLLFEVSPIDLPAFVTGAALLLLAALAATVVPARSASKMDPVATLARES